MIYRCRVCHHEDVRGWLPAATRGSYLLLLLGLSCAGIAGAAGGLRAWAGDRPVPAEPAEDPWWAGVVALGVGLALVAGGVGVVKFALELVEHLAFAGRRCPGCGARCWSWGFTRGFGL